MQKIILLLLLCLSCSCLKAQTHLDSLYTIWQDKTQPDSSRTTAYYKYIWDGFLFKQPDSAFTLAKELLVYAQENQFPKAKAEAYKMQGISFFMQGNYSQALDYQKRSLESYETIKDSTGIGNMLYNIGLIYKYQANYPQALDYYHRSLKIKEQIDDMKGTPIVLNDIGVIYYFQGNYPQGLDYFQRSLKTHEETGDKNGAAQALSNIGNIYLEQSNFSQALDNQQSALKIYEKLEYSKGIADIQVNIGIIYARQSDYPPALDYFKRSLNIIEETGDKIGVANLLTNIGNVYLEQVNFPQALEYHKRSSAIREEIGDKNGIANSLYNIGNIYLDQGMFINALPECERSLSLSEEIGAINTQKHACSCLYEAYKGMGKNKEALAYHEQLAILNDSIFNEENTKKLTQLEMQYEFDKKEATTELEQEKKDVIAAQELKQKNLERNGFMTGFGVVLLFAGVVFRQRNRIGKEKKRSEELLQNILPKEVAEELKSKGSADTKAFDMVSILFTDFKGFTQASEKLTAKELIEEINVCFNAFDHICEKYGIEKIKTIGDAYMAAGGLPVPSANSIKNTVLAALEMQSFISKRIIEKDKLNELSFKMRLGINTGPVVAGIVGIKKFQYDIWGDTVNTASRMESSGEIGKVNVSESTHELLKDDPEFTFEFRGKIDAKGKGEMKMYFVEKIIK